MKQPTHSNRALVWALGMACAGASLAAALPAAATPPSTAPVSSCLSRATSLGLPPGPLEWVGEHALYAVILLWLLSLAALWLLHRQGVGWRSVLVCLPPYGLLALYLWKIDAFV